MALHPGSLSSSRVRVAEHQVELLLRVQILSLLEVIPGLDADADGTVTPAEIQARDAEIFGYVDEHYTLWVGTDRELEGGERLLAEYQFLRRVDVDQLTPGTGARAGGVDVQLRYTHREPVRDLMLRSTLFADTSPDHVDTAVIEWADGTRDHFGLTAGAEHGRVDREGRGAFALFLRLGWEHILSGWDHLAFVALLVVSAASLRGLLAVVTAFTLSHSASLALVTLGVVDVSPWAHLVEPAIALTIAYVAADNLLRLKQPRARAVEAFVFGLVHGLGFAGYLGSSLLEEPSRGVALLGFNLGVEAGQIVVALALVAALTLVGRALGGRGDAAASKPDTGAATSRRGLAPIGLRAAVSGLLLVAGLAWFVERL